MNTETIKSEIKKSYGLIANGTIQVGCCAPEGGCCNNSEFGTSMSEGYDQVAGYQKDADLSLGCGLPTEIANIQPGNTVLDLGAGAGNDVFVARSLTGETGKVIGIDMTPEMVIRALQNNQKLGFKNVEFHLGEIEHMPVIASNSVDVVISNCVMNLVPDKEKAFREVHRVLKNGGHFSISDIVHSGDLPKGILAAAEMYAGCVAGASEKGNYLGTIKSVGFKNIQIKKERLISIPDDVLLRFITPQELKAFRKSGAGIYSITLYADKLDSGACCDNTDGNCCGSSVAETEVEKANTCCGATGFSSTGCCA